MSYFSYGFSDAYRLPGAGSNSILASSWLPNNWKSSSSLRPSSSLLVLVTHSSVQVWNAGQNRYLMGSWHVSSQSLITHAVVGEDGYVGLVVRNSCQEITSRDIVVLTFVKRASLKSLAWADSLQGMQDGERVPVEEVEVGEVWRVAAEVNGDTSSSYDAHDVPADPAGPADPVALVSIKGSKTFWVVGRDGNCVGYDWVRGVMVKNARIGVGSSTILRIGGCGMDSRAGEAVVPFMLSDRSDTSETSLSIGLVPWESVEAVPERITPAKEVPMMRVQNEKDDEITCIAVCPRCVHVAIGIASGVVVLRYIGWNGSDKPKTKPKITKILSLEEWGYSASDVGAVSALSWSPDGKVVAVGYARQGVSAWTTQGCRLFCTLVTGSGIASLSSPRLMAVGNGSGNGRPLSGKGSEKLEIGAQSPSQLSTDKPNNGANFISGVSYLAFSMHGSHLVIQLRRHPQMFLEVSFAKCFDNHALVEARSTHNSCATSTKRTAFSFLAGSDRLLVITPKLTIEHISVPQQYLDSAYPIITASLNKLKQDIAVVGVHGLAVYNIPSRKWRLIGDLSQDKALVVRHVGWVHNDVIVACADVRNTFKNKKKGFLASNGVKLLFFPKGHLDASSLLGAHSIPENLGMPQLMDVSNGRISLAFERKEVHVLRYRCLTAAGRDASNGSGPDEVIDSVELDLEYSFDIPVACSHGDHGNDPSDVLNMLKSLSIMQMADGSKSALLLWDNGDLGCINLHEQRFSLLATDIEDYWIHESNEERLLPGAGQPQHGQMGSMNSVHSTSLVNSNASIAESDDRRSTWWWTYGSKGMSLWLDDRCETTTPDPELGFDCEVLPIGICLEDMSVIGLTHRTQKRRAQYINPALSVDFFPVAESQPVLACLLRRLLLNNRFEHALQLADSYSSGSHFFRSMEWLLYTALDSSCSEGNVVLSKTTELISHFSQYSQLVVAVARKVDASMWPILFDAAGSPVDLCESSIRDGELDHAAACLLIVHDVVGPTEAARLAMKTLKSALATSKYNLCATIVSFLGDTVEIAEANQRQCVADGGVDGGNSGMVPGSGLTSADYVAWLWSWISPESAKADDSGRRDAATHGKSTKNAPLSMSLTERLHAAMSSRAAAYNHSTSPISTISPISPLVDAWRCLAKHAWHILDDGNVRELASMDKAMMGVHGGLAALLRTTKHLHPCSLGHITPSSSLIANAIFISGNEMASASPSELEEIPGLMKSLLSAGCINYGLALAIVSNDAVVMHDFAEGNKDTWDRLLGLVSNDVHLCSFASVLTFSAGGADLCRSLTL